MRPLGLFLLPSRLDVARVSAPASSLVRPPRPRPHPRRRPPPLPPVPAPARGFQSAAERTRLADLFDHNRSEARHRRQPARAPVPPASACCHVLLDGPASPQALTRATDASLHSASIETQRTLACCSECFARSRAFRERAARRQADTFAGRPVQRRSVPRRIRPPLRPYPPVVPLAPAVLYDQPAVPVHTIEAQQLFSLRVAQAGKLLIGVSILGGIVYAYLSVPALLAA